MANTYTWSIPQNGLMTVPTQAGQTNVVVFARYEVSGTDGTHTATTEGMARFTYNPGAPFTPFANLTQAEVIGWIQTSKADLVKQTETRLDNMIAQMANPPVIPKPQPNPWPAA